MTGIWAFRAEVQKLITLPATLLTIGATLIGALVVSHAVLTSARISGGTIGAPLLQRVPEYLALGTVTLGVLAATSEHQGNQVHTSLLAVPQRGLLITTKVTAFLLICATTAVAAMAVAWVAMGLTDPGMAKTLAGASAHLTVAGLFAHLIGIGVRHMIGAATTAIILLVVVPPIWELLLPKAPWLPTLASARTLLIWSISDLFIVGILTAWGVLTVGVAAARFVFEDG